MPIYEYECGKCQRHETGFRSIAERHNSPRCCRCKMKLIIMPSYIQDDIPPYVSPTTGRVIGSRTARRDDFARSRCRPWEGMEQEQKEAARKRKYIEEKHEKKLTDAAYGAFHQLPPSQRRLLEGSE